MKRVVILFALFILPLLAVGQCYQPSRTEAIKEFNAKHFEKAKEIFTAMLKCPDRPEKHDIEFWIQKCRQAANSSTRQPVMTFAERMANYEEYGLCGFTEGMMAVQKKADWKEFERMPEGVDERNYAPKVGFVNENGILVIPCVYEDLDFYTWKSGYCFSEGVAAVLKRFPDDSENTIYVAWGYIDKKGNEVIPFEYSDAQPFSEGLAAVQTDFDAYWKFIDKTGKVAMQEEFFWAGVFSEGLCIVKPDSTSKGVGYIDKTGKLVIPAKYSDAYNFKNGVAAVFNEEHGYEAALINKKGQMVGDFTFRPEYLRPMDIEIYAVEMYNSGQYDKCLMAIRGHEKRCLERGQESDVLRGVLPYMEGYIYYKGLGSQEQDYTKAFETFCLGNESNALYMQASCYRFGHGVARNFSKALELYHASIERNNWRGHGYVSLGSGQEEGVLNEHFTKGMALYCIGVMYYNGEGVEKDYRQALNYFKQSDEAGYAPAKKMMESCTKKISGE